MPSPIKKVFFEDYVFFVSENVYEPAEDSFLFAENLVVKEGDVVLDMGTGCGILGVVAAEKAAKVVAVDVNPYAVRCAKKNAKLNGVSNKIFFVQGDLFTAIRIGERLGFSENPSMNDIIRTAIIIQITSFFVNIILVMPLFI